MILYGLGQDYRLLGDTQQAIEIGTCALALALDIGHSWWEGYALNALGCARLSGGDALGAITAFEEARTVFQKMGDRTGEAESNWHHGLLLAQQNKRAQALALLRTALIYEQEIGHAKAAEHTTLLARLEAGEPLPPELRIPTDQSVIGSDPDKPTTDNT